MVSEDENDEDDDETEVNNHKYSAYDFNYKKVNHLNLNDMTEYGEFKDDLFIKFDFESNSLVQTVDTEDSTVFTITEAQNPGAQEVFLKELCNELQIRKCNSSFSMEKLYWNS